MKKKKKEIDSKFIFKGNVTINSDNAAEWEEKLKGIQQITGDLYIYSNVTFSADALKSVGGYLSISSNVTFSADALKSVGGYLYIYSNVTEELEKQLWKHNPKNIWHVTDLASDWLLSREGNIFYSINRVSFEKPLFDAIRKGTLSAAEVFAIENIEQRRVAYEKMNKFKIRELPSYQIIDEVKNDGFGYPMKLISFIAPNIKEAFKFLNCFDPSTGREYFLECFNAKTCAEAKVNSFGLGDSIKFTAEW